MSEFTNGINVGDIITAYHKGYHIVTKVERRFVDTDYKLCGGRGNIGDEYEALIEYRTVLTKDFKPQKSKSTKCCDALYCQPLNKTDIVHEKTVVLKDTGEGYDRLIALLK